MGQWVSGAHAPHIYLRNGLPRSSLPRPQNPNGAPGKWVFLPHLFCVAGHCRVAACPVWFNLENGIGLPSWVPLKWIATTGVSVSYLAQHASYFEPSLVLTSSTWQPWLATAIIGPKRKRPNLALALPLTSGGRVALISHKIVGFTTALWTSVLLLVSLHQQL